MRVKVRHDGWGMAAAEPRPEREFFSPLWPFGFLPLSGIEVGAKAPIEVVPRIQCVCSSSRLNRHIFILEVMAGGDFFLKKEVPSRTLPKKTTSGFFWFRLYHLVCQCSRIIASLGKQLIGCIPVSSRNSFLWMGAGRTFLFKGKVFPPVSRPRNLRRKEHEIFDCQ